MASVIDPGERRVGQQQPAPRRDAVRLVVEPLGEHLGEVLDRRLAQQLGVDRGDAVGAVRTDDGQVGHADLPVGPSSIEAHALDPAVVAREAVPHLVEQRRLISWMISRSGAETALEPRTGHFSRASGSSV